MKKVLLCFLLVVSLLGCLAVCSFADEPEFTYGISYSKPGPSESFELGHTVFLSSDLNSSFYVWFWGFSDLDSEVVMQYEITSPCAYLEAPGLSEAEAVGSHYRYILTCSIDPADIEDDFAFKVRFNLNGLFLDELEDDYETYFKLDLLKDHLEESVLSNVSGFVGSMTSIWQNVVNVVTASGNEILLLGVIAWLFVLGIGSVRRLITGV